MAETRRELVAEIIEEMGAFRRSMFGRRAHGPRFGAIKNVMSISPVQGELLHLLASRETLTVTEIARIMGVTGSAVTQMVDPLVRKGLLDREHDEDDRRVVRICLSSKAKTMHAMIENHLDQHFSELLEPLSVEELRTFRDLMQKIINNQDNLKTKTVANETRRYG
jgi:DNA-binding MarR family transcriptional regulator